MRAEPGRQVKMILMIIFGPTFGFNICVMRLVHISFISTFNHFNNVPKHLTDQKKYEDRSWLQVLENNHLLSDYVGV